METMQKITITKYAKLLIMKKFYPSWGKLKSTHRESKGKTNWMFS